MMNKKTFVTALLALAATAAVAQGKRVESWIYADVSLSSDSAQRAVKAMVDTGCSVCVIDSAYAADELGMGPDCYIAKFKNRLNTIALDSVRFCGKTYRDVLCMVFNLERDFVDYAPMFIVGGNILNTGAWNFDLASKTIEPCKVGRKTSGVVLHWKGAKNKLNFIVFKGKIGSRRVSFVLDTGARHCKLPKGVDAGATETVMKEKASVGHPLQWTSAERSKDVRFKIGKNEFVHDFYHDHETEYGLLNSTAFGGSSLVLDYQKKILVVKE